MQLQFQQPTGTMPGAMINRFQDRRAGYDPTEIRAAVRAWSAADSQDAVACLIIDEWEAQGGKGIDFPPDITMRRQKLFRILDNRYDTEQYRERIQQLTPAILAVLPLEFRHRLAPEDNFMARFASMEKELSEAKRALMLNAPRHQLVKEVREGIEHLLGMLPVDALAPVLSGLASIAPGLM